MTQSICIFEDPGYNRLLPLVYMRPTYELRCGITALRQKLVRCYPGVPVTLRSRSYLSDLVRQQNPGIPVNSVPASSCLFLNGRVIADESFAAQIPLHGEDTVYVQGDTLVAARVSGSALDRLRPGLPDTPSAADFDGIKQQTCERTHNQLSMGSGERQRRRDHGRFSCAHRRHPEENRRACA